MPYPRLHHDNMPVRPLESPAVEGSAVMKQIASVERQRTWIVDYSAARARAIEWLGDRYLLARPINVHAGRRSAPRHPAEQPSPRSDAS